MAVKFGHWNKRI